MLTAGGPLLKEFWNGHLENSGGAVEVAADFSGGGVVVDYFVVAAGGDPYLVFGLEGGVVEGLAALEIDDFVVEAVDDEDGAGPEGFYFGGGGEGGEVGSDLNAGEGEADVVDEPIERRGNIVFGDCGEGGVEAIE